MPRGTPFVKVQQTRAFGAEVVLDGECYEDAYEPRLELRDERDLVFVHPFNDIDVMAGQGTIALEMLEDAPDLEVLPVPVGGGGLISGVATAAKHIKPEISILGVEPASFPSFTARMRGAGPSPTPARPSPRASPSSQVGDLSYAIARPLIDDVLLIEEPFFERGVALYCNVEKTVAEGAGAASLAARAGLSGAVPRQEGRADPHRRQHRPPPAGLGADPRAGARAAAGVAALHRRRPAGPFWANVSAVIGALGANIVEVTHNRLSLDVPAKGAEFDIMIETRDARAHPGAHRSAARAGLPAAPAVILQELL